MLKRIAGSAAALTLAVAGIGLVGASAHAQTGGSLVVASDIPKSETKENYNTWHQGANPGNRFASTLDGLFVEGKTQIIKGESELPAVGELLAYAESSEIVATGAPVWHQIGFGLAGGPWTTLRVEAGKEAGPWTTSQPLSGIGAHGSAPLETLLGGLEGELAYLSGGFYVDTGQKAMIKSYSVDGMTTTFALPALSTEPERTERVLSKDIRPNEDTYGGWHEGAGAGGSYVSTVNGLELVGKAQILNGELDTSTQVAQFVSSLAIETDSPDVWYQVPVMAGEQFTTLRATSAMAAEGKWVSSQPVHGLAKGVPLDINDIVLAIGDHVVWGYGFYVDPGVTATVKSITANGLRTEFNTPPPFVPSVEAPGSGLGEGTAENAPAAEGAVSFPRGAAVPFAAPAGIFEPGEPVTVSLFGSDFELGTLTADPETGVVAGELTIADDAPLGEHRVLLQGAQSHFWQPYLFTVTEASTDGGGTGDGDGTDGGSTGGTDSKPGTKDPQLSAGKGSGAAAPLAATGAATTVAALVAGLVALVGGAGLVLARRRLS